MLYIDDLKKTYPGFELEASLKVLPGRITGLVGENGSGKTTLFKAILGLIHTDGGQAALFGKPTEKLSAADRIRIGAVLADSGFSAYITIRDAGRILKGLYPSFREDWFQEQCLRYGLPENKKIKELINDGSLVAGSRIATYIILFYLLTESILSYHKRPSSFTAFFIPFLSIIIYLVLVLKFQIDFQIRARFALRNIK